jgi:hypothetical protein
MTLRERLSAALADAIRNDNPDRVAILRLMLVALRDRDIAMKGEEGQDGLTEEEAMRLLTQMVRQREESIRAYEQAGRMELAEQERHEIAVIRDFLPAPLTDEEVAAAIREAIEETGARSIRDLGRVMARLKARHAGRIDPAAIGQRVKEALE